MKDPNAPLPAYAWPGGYPVFYLAKDGATLCAKCATEERDDIDASGIHWEGEPILCDGCGVEIESAYGTEEVDQ